MTVPEPRHCPACQTSVYPTPTNQCPICGRDLSTPVAPVNLEYQTYKMEFSLDSAFKNGWAAFQRNMGLAIGGGSLWLVLHMIGSLVPFVNYIYGYFVSCAMTGGLILFGINLVRNRNPSIGDIFGGFERYLRTLGVFWLNFLIMLVSFIPMILCVIIAMIMKEKLHSEFVEVSMFLISGLISTVISCILFSRWCLALNFVMDDNCTGVIDAFQRSAIATEGVRLKIIGYGIVLVITAYVGFFACCIGAIFSIPFALCCGTVLYEALKTRVPQS